MEKNVRDLKVYGCGLGSKRKVNKENSENKGKLMNYTNNNNNKKKYNILIGSAGECYLNIALNTDVTKNHDTFEGWKES